MANVTDRGQIILITGFVIAVTLVAVVLLLNTVIYTENIATRSIDSSPGEALEFRDASKEALASLINATNYDKYGSQASVSDALETNLSNVTDLLRRTYIDGGTIGFFNNSSITTVPGVLLQQTNSTRSFLNDQGHRNWELATGVQGARQFRMSVERDSLDNKTNVSEVISNNDTFGVRLEGDNGKNWTAYLYTNNTGHIYLATNASGVHCSVNSTNATIDLTGNGIVGINCASYDWAVGIIAPYNISFLNGNQSEGSYNLTVKPNTSYVTENFDDVGSPEAWEAVYSATVTIHYETPTLIYETDLRVAPGEDDA